MGVSVSNYLGGFEMWTWVAIASIYVVPSVALVGFGVWCERVTSRVIARESRGGVSA